MTDDELIADLRRQFLAIIRLFERRFGRSLNLDIQIVRKDG